MVTKNISIDLPLRLLERTRKKDGKEFWFSCNLNAYTQAAKCTFRRNAIKQAYEKTIKPLLDFRQFITSEISLKYTLYVGTKRRCDLSNVCCIIDKYFSDALVNNGIIEDDSYEYIKNVQYVYGGYDKANPRCVVEIKCKE